MFISHTLLTLRWALRDRLLHAVLGTNLVLLLLIPAFSLFSMRQVQELAVTLCFSLLAMVLLVLVLLLGGFSLWREVDRRYTAAVLTLPASRASFVLGRFCGIVIFLVGSTILVSLVSAAVICASRGLYPSESALQWNLLGIAAAGMLGKFILLAAFAVLLSSVSTSFALPFFGTISIYLVGSASQQVFEFLSIPQTTDISPVLSSLTKTLYYLLPNFSVFDYKVQAIYGLPLDFRLLIFSALYLASYSGICLGLAIVTFSRRQFP